MGFHRWWHYGLLGSLTLTLATSRNLLRAIPDFVSGKHNPVEAVRLLAATFGMGFLCGIVVWLGKGLSHRFGLAGDALVGSAVGVVFFDCCMLLFAPQMCGDRFFIDGLPMLMAGGAIGVIMGIWIGFNCRRERAKLESKARGQAVEDSEPSSTR